MPMSHVLIHCINVLCCILKNWTFVSFGPLKNFELMCLHILIVEEVNSHRAQKKGGVNSKVNAYIALLPSRQPIDRQMSRRSTTARKRAIARNNKIHPTKKDPAMEELEEQGLDVSNLEDEEDIYRVMNAIKQLPCPLAAKRRFRWARKSHSLLPKASLFFLFEVGFEKSISRWPLKP